VSSRCYSIRRQQFTFASATPQQVAEFVARKVFWGSGAGAPASPPVAGGGGSSERQAVLVADPCDALYLGRPIRIWRRNWWRRRRTWRRAG